MAPRSRRLPPPRAGAPANVVPRPTTGARFQVAFSLRALSIVCVLLYALAQVGAAIAGWVEFVAEQQQHGQAPQILGDDGYAWTLLEQTMQNWQSEFLALALLIVLSAFLLHRGSHHSRDGNDEAKARIEQIKVRVDDLVSRRQDARKGGTA